MASRLRAFAARPAVLLSIGLAISAVAGSIGFQPIINRGLDSAGVNALIGLNTVLTTVSTGVMAGLEQEMTRVVSRALAIGASAATAIRRQVRHATWLIAATLVVVGALGPVLTERYLGGEWILFAELLVGLFGALASFQVRGTLSGRQDFPIYSLTLVVQGMAVLVPFALIWVLGLSQTWLFGLFLALAQGMAALSGLAGPLLRRGRRAGAGTGPTEPAKSVETQSVEALEPPETTAAAADAAAHPEESRGGANIAMLTAATLASQLLLNAVTLLTLARYGHTGNKTETNQVSAIGTAVGVTRLGILILLPMQAPLLPRLTAAATHGRFTEVRRRTRALAGLCAVAGLLAIAVCWTIGPWVLRVFMHAHAPLSGTYLAALAAGIGFMMVAYILQSTLIALKRHQVVMAAWWIGVAATLPVFLAGSSIFVTTAIAGFTGPLVTMLIMVVDAWRSTRGGDRVPDIEIVDGPVAGGTDPTHIDGELHATGPR
jgi:O-antigen/teichoic acid export membrane protein